MKSNCRLCGDDNLTSLPEYSNFKRVTSDCKPWRSGGQLGICGQCGCIQIIVDEQWRGEIDEIYKNYTIYYQGDGAEQSVFDQSNGVAMARSDCLIDKIKKNVSLPQHGRLLDFGCGNGGFLRSFNRLFPDWALSGLEYDDKYLAVVESIPNVERLFTKGLDQVQGKFDAISLIHVLEHIESPRDFLEGIRARLSDGGYVFIELPHYVENPFELLIADHATHFSAHTIQTLIQSVGLKIDAVQTEWIPKELSVIARNLPLTDDANTTAVAPVPSISFLLKWLNSVAADARSVASRSRRFGLFGTSIAATWLFGELRERVAFFVDEDANRAGKKHFELPIYNPVDIPASSDVYVVLPPRISAGVALRLRSGDVFYHQVPDWE